MPILSTVPAVLAAAAVAALIAYAAYRRAGRRRSEALRAELWAEQESLRASLEELRAKIDLARQFRTDAAKGTAAAKAMDLDLSEVERLKSQLSANETDHNSSDMEVEIKLVEILALSLRAGTLAENYRAPISVQEIRKMDRESLTDDAEAPIREPRYSLDEATSSAVESVV